MDNNSEAAVTAGSVPQQGNWVAGDQGNLDWPGAAAAEQSCVAWFTTSELELAAEQATMWLYPEV